MSGGAEAADLLDAVLAAAGAGSREEWLFLLVNRAVVAAPYDRAAAWSLSGGAALLAVSGAVAPDGDGAFASAWKPVVRGLLRPDACAALGAETVADGAALEEALRAVPGTAAVWAPVPGMASGIVFERWDGAFSEAERLRLARFVAACSLSRSGGARAARSGRGRWRVRIAAALLLLAVLAFVRLPLRIAAECEVAARNPRLVAAPMDGVLAEVVARPGERVGAGDVLAVYDARLMEEELNILRRQVEVAETELATARARGFAEQRYRAETARLEAGLSRERARLRALETRYALREIAAPVEGMVQLDDPRAWRGRPVATGQAILWLVEPSETRVRIWLPQDDRIGFDPDRPVGVHLHAFGGEARLARLTYVSAYAQAVGDGSGRYAFPAEAEWMEGERNGEGNGDGKGAGSPPLGVRGTAFLYGERVSLGYWLLRRPLGWVRRVFGV